MYETEVWFGSVIKQENSSEITCKLKVQTHTVNAGTFCFVRWRLVKEEREEVNVWVSIWVLDPLCTWVISLRIQYTNRCNRWNRCNTLAHNICMLHIPHIHVFKHPVNMRTIWSMEVRIPQVYFKLKMHHFPSSTRRCHWFSSESTELHRAPGVHTSSRPGGALWQFMEDAVFTFIYLFF